MSLWVVGGKLRLQYLPVAQTCLESSMYIKGRDDDGAQLGGVPSPLVAIESGKLAKVPRRFWCPWFGSSAKFLAVLKLVCNKRLRQKCFHIAGRAPLRVPLHCLGEVTEGAACRNARVRTLTVAIPRSNNTVVLRACRCCVQVVVQAYHAGLFADGVVEWPVH